MWSVCAWLVGCSISHNKPVGWLVSWLVYQPSRPHVSTNSHWGFVGSTPHNVSTCLYIPINVKSKRQTEDYHQLKWRDIFKQRGLSSKPPPPPRRLFVDKIIFHLLEWSWGGGGGASVIYSKKRLILFKKHVDIPIVIIIIMWCTPTHATKRIRFIIRIIVMIIAKLRDRDDNTTVQNTCLCNQSVNQSIISW